VENMSGFVCPKCGELTQILPEGGGRKIASDMKVPFLGAIPIDPGIAQSGDTGKVFIYHSSQTPTGKIMQDIIDQIQDTNSTKKLDS
ncbi:MAG: P-loop NTPase, partial [Smithellaceae bacterium]|nr:P-loop NTPase [Smithellaceae bacterium]